ncbi:hypothetical protein CHX26_08635 [Porphyrobacter sp. HT-58-2]|uniref:hypothetical protein n=1 Tax=Porphyrobacter sp. HT-58-2 TaxID=2023229 RepID=UPI000CDCD35D|nr:hypothetical protein [Porphyrobacter sp. HT-58-2]AUX69547.1 hypothetical protein CHX26_08635 [Porphyrobacter sp. HT-58-2]
MGSNASDEPGAFVGRLADQARRLQREARNAIAQGDYSRASALIDDAELLADDVHGLVDDIEHRETDRLMELAAAATTTEPPADDRLRPPRRRLRVAIGASLAMSLALTEC